MARVWPGVLTHVCTHVCTIVPTLGPAAAQGWQNVGKPQETAFSWTAPLGTWMAWTPATIAFFAGIAGLIALMGLWEFFSPGGSPRRGIFAIDTTRGDRLFISLLGSAFIMMAWIALVSTTLWVPLGICLVWAALVFAFV
jgi:predicted small integral membrane protein